MKFHVPKLIIGGAIKSGTTSVFDYLSGHPEVCASAIKEPHVLLTAKEPQDLVAEYKVLFADCKNPDVKIFLEASTGYINHGMTVIQNISAISPNCKFLFILRNPIERLYSYYKFQVSRLNLPETMEFSTYIAISEGRTARPSGLDEKFFGILEYGHYANYLAAWYQHWPDRNIKVALFDDLVADPGNFMKDVSRFIGVDDSYFDDFEFAPSNPTISARLKTIHRLSHKLNKLIKPFLMKHPKLKKDIFDFYQGLNSSKKQAAVMSKENRMFLEGYYQESTIKLDNLLDRKLSD